MKFNTAIISELGDGGTDRLKNLISTILGIKEISVNKIAKSATLLYDKSIYKKESIETLFCGLLPEELSTHLTSKEES